jgi:hypothetical protein
MPFSRSQNSKTAKKSAFIHSMLRLYPANKKVGRYAIFRLGALGDPANFTILGFKFKFLTGTRQAQTNLRHCWEKYRFLKGMSRLTHISPGPLSEGWFPVASAKPLVQPVIRCRRRYTLNL